MSKCYLYRMTFITKTDAKLLIFAQTHKFLNLFKLQARGKSSLSLISGMGKPHPSDAILTPVCTQALDFLDPKTTFLAQKSKKVRKTFGGFKKKLYLCSAFERNACYNSKILV